MNNIFNLPNTVCNLLKEESNIENVTFITKYPNYIKSSPLQQSVVGVGIKSVDYNTSGIGFDNKLADVQLSFCICVPLSNKSEKCFEIADKIFEFLWSRQELGVSKWDIGEISVKRQIGAFEINANVILSNQVVSENE